MRFGVITTSCDVCLKARSNFSSTFTQQKMVFRWGHRIPADMLSVKWSTWITVLITVLKSVHALTRTPTNYGTRGSAWSLNLLPTGSSWRLYFRFGRQRHTAPLQLNSLNRFSVVHTYCSSQAWSWSQYKRLLYLPLFSRNSNGMLRKPQQLARWT